MITYKSLEKTDINIIYQAFVEAFSDYQVDFNLTFEKFYYMMSRRGFNPYISIGAFDNDKLVGFILNGHRLWNDEDTAYDCGTGVIASYRQLGISSTIISKVKDLLIKHDIKQYLLEVIQSNKPAYNLYKKHGFEITREFNCFYLDKVKLYSECKYTFKVLDDLNFNYAKDFWDYIPSWQNSIDSILAVKESYTIIGAFDNKQLIGYGIITNDNGDIPQLAVDKDYRRQGIGKELINQLQDYTQANTIAFLNVDASNYNMSDFLTKRGFINNVQQYEMILIM